MGRRSQKVWWVLGQIPYIELLFVDNCMIVIVSLFCNGLIISNVALEHTIQGLEVSKSSYQKLLEENRLLYNQVQDLKGRFVLSRWILYFTYFQLYSIIYGHVGNIRVYCRVRPFISNQVDGKSTVDYIGENGNIMVVNPHKQGKEARRIFSFNRVFGVNASQREFIFTLLAISSNDIFFTFWLKYKVRNIYVQKT